MGESFNGRTAPLQGADEGSTPSSSTNEPATTGVALSSFAANLPPGFMDGSSQNHAVEAPIEATPVKFPEVAILRPCTSVTCRNGHNWTPKLALAKCGYGTPQGWMGCGEPMLAMKMEMCGICNEPIVKLKLRFDITPPVPYPVPICIPGSKSNAEVLQIEVHPQYWKTTEDELDKKAAESTETKTQGT